METDSHSYLHNDSSHNPKCITSIPFSELLRLRRLCSDDDDFKTKANEMSTFFSNCSYSKNTIQSAINRISKISQAEALQPRPKQSTTKRTPLVLTYHPHIHRIKRIFLRNFKKILQHEKSDTKHIFTSPPLQAYRRDTNLKQLLVRSSLNLKPNGTHPCGHSLCCTCEHTNPSDAISGPKNTFHIQHHFTCSSVCVIYSITCTKCSTLYIGETCRQLNTRFGEHLRSVEEKKHLPLNIKMMMTSTLQFILTYPTTQSMTWEFLLFYTHQPKNCPEKPWRKKSSLNLEQLPHPD